MRPDDLVRPRSPPPRRRLRALPRGARLVWTPRATKILAVCVVAYLASPIDLIPDFIPVLGYLDDLVLVPLGIALAIRMITPEVWTESREKARATMREGGSGGRAAAAIIVVVWLGLVAPCAWLAVRLFR